MSQSLSWVGGGRVVPAARMGGLGGGCESVFIVGGLRKGGPSSSDGWAWSAVGGTGVCP